MTDETAPPPVPQPGWVATVQIQLVVHDLFAQGRHAVVQFQNGCQETIALQAIDGLDWQPPAPPPWEPEIGQPASIGFQPVIVRGLHNGLAWVEDLDGDMLEERISDLSPPKGGAS